ncbi:MAG: DNA polymerase IV [Candidatus Latescibacterota bacterium]
MGASRALSRSPEIAAVGNTPPKARICCLDLDTFFVSVERLFRPDLIGKPVVVGALPRSRGVVTACSYEVRALGVRSGMAIAEAYRLAPNAIYLSGRHGEYGEYARQVKGILDRYTPIVRTASIDEYFLDFRQCEGMYRQEADRDGDATIERVVREVCQAIQDEVGLPASAGIATSRPIAKMASNVAKPAGVRLVRAGEEHAFVEPLPCRKWPGIGPVADERLRHAGIYTLGELLAVSQDSLGRSLYASVRQVVSGQAESELGRDRPAFREHDPEGLTLGSISNESTFGHDVGDLRAITDRLRSLGERVCWRARQRNVFARTITLKLRYADFETLTRARTIKATNTESRVLTCVKQLFRDNYDGIREVRLLGIALSGLEEATGQLELALDDRSRPHIGKAIDAVRERFGYDAIRLGMEQRSGG